MPFIPDVMCYLAYFDINLKNIPVKVKILLLVVVYTAVVDTVV